jgi:hypothetical protein
MTLNLKKRINAEVKVLASIDMGKDELNAGVWRKVLKIIAGRMGARAIDYNDLRPLLNDYASFLIDQELKKQAKSAKKNLGKPKKSGKR